MKFSHSFTLFGKRFTVSLTLIVLFAILAIASYLRFLNFPLTYGFDFDPTRDALIVIEGAKHLHFPLNGPKSGIGPFAFGPWYYYELILFKLLFPHPFSPWIFIGITSVLTVAVMYLIGKALEGQLFGLLLALLTAFSPEQIGPTDGLSNPNLIPLHAAITVLLFVYYLKEQKKHWVVWLLWGLIFGIGVNHHYQMILLAPLPFMAFVYKRNKQALRDAGLFLIGCAISFVPLFLYNLQNHWKTLTGGLFYLTTSHNATYIPNRWLFYVRDFWIYFLSMLSGVPERFALVLIALTIAVFAYLALKKKLTPVYLFLIATFLLDFIFLRYFAVRKELYYFLFLHPLLFIFFGFALWQIHKLKFGAIAVAFILLAMLPFVWHQDMQRKSTNEYLVRSYNEAKTLEHAFPDKDIAIYGCTTYDIKYLNYPQGVAFFLENDNRLSQNGLPIALPTMICPKEILSNNGIIYSSIPDSNGILLHSPTPTKLTHLNWVLVTPQTVFFHTLEE